MSQKFLTVINDIFTKEECQKIIKLFDTEKLDPIDRGIAKYHRNSLVITPQSDHNWILAKIKEKVLLPSSIDGFKVTGFNKLFRFSKYHPGQFFDIHKDGVYQDDTGSRSVYTLNIFLNENFEGGSTDFYDENKNLRYSVHPRTGRGALFDSQQYHAGKEVTKGFKYLLRTDVMIQ